MRYSSARQMIFDAYQVRRDSVLAGAIEKARLGVDIQFSQRQNNDWRIVHGLEAGAVISRVESLPMHLQALARYCFGPFTREELVEDGEQVQIALYRHLLDAGVRLPGQGKRLLTAGQLETLLHLCAAALYHHSQATWPYSRPGLSTPRAVQTWMADEKGVDIDVRFWTRTDRATWGMVWDRMRSVLDSWEAEALAPVSGLLPKAA